MKDIIKEYVDKEVKNNKGILPKFEYSKKEGRTYIDNPSKAPKGVKIQKGARGGYYYITEPNSNFSGTDKLHDKPKVDPSINDKSKGKNIPEVNNELKKNFPSLKNTTMDIELDDDGTIDSVNFAIEGKPAKIGDKIKNFDGIKKSILNQLRKKDSKIHDIDMEIDADNWETDGTATLDIRPKYK